MRVEADFFNATVGELKGECAVVEARITAVDGHVLVRTQKHHVLQFVIAAP